MNRWKTPIRAIDKRLIAFESTHVWRVLTDLDRSELWWPESLRMKILKVTPNVVGSEFRIWPKGGKPFYCRIIELQSTKKMRTEYFGGFIQGYGEWLFEEKGSHTQVAYSIEVAASGLLTKILGLFFSYSAMHSLLMSELFDHLEYECATRQKAK